MIPTVYNEQHLLLRAVIKLYSPGGFNLDPTYSKGGFYSTGHIPQPEYKFDLLPQSLEVIKADCRNLPLEINSIGSIIFDPPFLHAGGKNSKMGNRFGSYPSQSSLFNDLYVPAGREFNRVLHHEGILCWKCQDTVESGKQVYTHIKIFELLTSLGFIIEDLFILTASNRMRGWNHSRQLHARKFHSFFWVARKEKERRNKCL